MGWYRNEDFEFKRTFIQFITFTVNQEGQGFLQTKPRGNNGTQYSHPLPLAVNEVQQGVFWVTL